MTRSIGSGYGYGYGYDGQMSDPQGMPLTGNAPWGWGTTGHAANRHCPLEPAPASVRAAARSKRAPIRAAWPSAALSAALRGGWGACGLSAAKKKVSAKNSARSGQKRPILSTVWSAVKRKLAAEINRVIPG